MPMSRTWSLVTGHAGHGSRGSLTHGSGTNSLETGELGGHCCCWYGHLQSWNRHRQGIKWSQDKLFLRLSWYAACVVTCSSDVLYHKRIILKHYPIPQYRKSSSFLDTRLILETPACIWDPVSIRELTDAGSLDHAPSSCQSPCYQRHCGALLARDSVA